MSERRVVAVPPHRRTGRRRALAALVVAAASIAVLVAPGSAAWAADRFGGNGAQLVKQDLATSGIGSPYYRIAALTVTDDGTLIAAYDARPTLSDLPSNITDVIRRSTDGGRTWTAQQIVRGAAAPNGYGDPSLLVDRRTGRIFDFYAAGVNQGFLGSATGNDESDPNVLQADYSYSDDDGVTWTSRRITAQIKNPAWGGLFAASGQGIQLTSGPHAGRLVQQYVIEINGGEYAASAYSDDDGASWQMGTPVGPGMNENKTVQLSDGRVLLDVRATPDRLLATSTDGGVTYSPPVANAELPDPSDNGSIIRYAPDAPSQDPRSRWLLESNNDSTSSRSNLVVKLSCDDGKTWPVTRVVEPGAAAYSSLTNLPNGNFGLLYERGDYTNITYASFGPRWLAGACAELSGAPVTSGPTVLGPGPNQAVPVTVPNTGTTDQAPGTLTLQAPSGWTTGAVNLPRLGAGWSLTVPVPVTIGATAASGPAGLTARFTTGNTSSSGPVPVTVLAGQPVFSAGPLVTDGVHAVDESASLPSVRALSSGTIAVRFHTTQVTAAGTLLSAADPTSNVKDLVLSLNSGRPYVEVRTDTNTYPVRISGNLFAADGREHIVTVTSGGGQTVLGLDGQVAGVATTSALFGSVTGLANLTVGANVAAAGTRWQYAGAIDSVTVTP